LVATFEYVIVSAVIYWVVCYFRTVFKINPQNKVVLISGCDSGFGNGTALELSRLGFKVIAGCYTQSGFNSFEGVKNVTAIHLDITSQNSISEAFEVVEKLCPNGLWALINNAGIAEGLNLEFTSMEIYRKVMEVNFFGHVMMTKKFLPLIKKRKGRIVNMASIAGRTGSALVSAYCASKHAMEGWSDSLRQDMSRFGIHVIVVEPGFMNTPIVQQVEHTLKRCILATPKETLEEYGGENFENSLKSSYSFLNNLSEDPKKVVDAYINACISAIPKSRYVVGIHSWIILIDCYLPSWLRDRIGILKYIALLLLCKIRFNK